MHGGLAIQMHDRLTLVATPVFFSDFAITPKWFVLAKPPLKVDGLGAALGKTFSEVLEYDPAGTSELIFATRLKRDEAEIVIPVDNLVCEEFVNAYEDGNRVILDMVAADRWDGKAQEGRPKWEETTETTWPKLRLVRYEVDLASQTWTKTEGPLQKNLCFTSVNPTLNGKKQQFIFWCRVSRHRGTSQWCCESEHGHWHC